MGRELTFANPRIIEIINDFFVPVAMDDWYQRRRQDAEGDFFRSVANQGSRQGNGTRQGIYAFTADGRLLNYRNQQDPEVMRRFLLDALYAWRDLPPAQRAKGAVKVPELKSVDARFAPALPTGAVIINTYGRILDRKESFYCHGTCKVPGGQRASHDHLWLRAEECEALMPTEVKKGQEIAIPIKFLYRLIRFSLVDNTRGEPPMWKREDIRKGSFKLVVEEAAADSVRLKLTGGCLIATNVDPAQAKRGYDAALLGEIRYDPKKRVLTKFDVVALGDHWGEGPFTGGSRPGRSPFGISFELGDPTRPADRVAPQFIREGGDYWNADR